MPGFGMILDLIMAVGAINFHVVIWRDFMSGKDQASNKAKGKKKATKDDRSSQRVPIQLLVDYQSNGNYLFDFCRDLGTGGVFIETNSPLDLGADVNLTFTLPDSKETVDAKGKVIWVQPEVPGKKLSPGMGIQFDNFSSDQRVALESFIERLQSHSPSKGSQSDRSA